MQYDPSQTDPYQVQKTLQSNQYNLPSFFPTYTLSPFYAAVFPYGPSDSSADQTERSHSKFSDSPIEAVTHDILQSQPSDPLDRFLSSKRSFLAKSVEELELSVRSYNCLKNANIQTISELVQKGDG